MLAIILIMIILIMIINIIITISIITLIMMIINDQLSNLVWINYSAMDLKTCEATLGINYENRFLGTFLEQHA